MKKLVLLTTLPFIVMAKPVYVDEILTEQNEVKLDVSMAYSNIQRANGVQSAYTYQTQNGDFVSIPTYVGDTKTNQDYLNYSFTLRYGLTKDLELFTSANLYNSETKTSLNDTFHSISSKGFNSLNFGFTYQVKKESDTPSLLLGLSTNIIDKTKFNTKTLTSHFKQYRIFATSFYTVDPVVFLTTASYGVNLKKSLDENSIENGNIFTLSPQVYFAVNPYTSLNWGVKYSHYGENFINNKQVSNSASSISFLMGMSYEFSAKTVLTMSAEYVNNNDIVQSNVSTTLSYNF